MNHQDARAAPCLTPADTAIDSRKDSLPPDNQGWNFGVKYITLWPSTVRQGAKYGPTKAGLAHRLGWVGYLNDGNLFVKRFDYQEGKTYPDNGCNLETFANADMLG